MAFQETAPEWKQYRAMRKSSMRKDMVPVRLWALDHYPLREKNPELFDRWNAHGYQEYTPTEEEKPMWDQLEYIHGHHGMDYSDILGIGDGFNLSYYIPKYEGEAEYDGTEGSVDRIYNQFTHQGDVWTGDVIQAGDDFWYIDMVGFTQVNDTFGGLRKSVRSRKSQFRKNILDAFLKQMCQIFIEQHPEAAGDARSMDHDAFVGKYRDQITAQLTDYIRYLEENCPEEAEKMLMELRSRH